MQRLLLILRALADSTRLRIMLLLREMELSVGELVAILGQSQPRVSRHVRILCDAGLAERRKEGSWVFLRPGPVTASPDIAPLLAASEAATSPAAVADRTRLDEVRAERAERAQEYFEAHAEEWDAIRSLHVAESEVENAMEEALDGEPIGRLLDIGTGTGRVAELFARDADYIAALDKSPEMLRLARAKLHGESESDVDIILGDFNDLPVDAESFDTVIMHQSLHFAQAPEHAVAEASRVLGPGGRLLIADFAPHEREELREKSAHARLGFADESIARWMAGAGLVLTESRALEGGELAVKIWLGKKDGKRLSQRPSDRRAA